MFEQELENIQKLAVDNTIGNQPSIALKTILESNIPANIKSFFRGHVEWLLYKEKLAERRSEKFNYRQEDVQLLQEQMDILLVYHYTFSREDFRSVLDSAAHFLFNYLCRPQWTLDSYLFEERPLLSVPELAVKFRFCGDYPYYWTILERFLTGKHRTEIDREETIRLLRRIDAEIVSGHTAEELAKMTIPFYEFVGYIHQHSLNGGRGDLPTKALAYFFEDKRLTGVSQHLQRLREQGKQTLLFDELVQELKESHVQKNVMMEEETFSSSAPSSSATPSSSSAASSLPSAPDAPRPLRSLLIPERERLNIVRALFGNDEGRYSVIVEKILSAASWDDAGLSLDHYFTMNDVDPFSRDAIILTNALQSYFTNRDL